MDNKTKIYLTASGILGAILLVWAQLWNDLAIQYYEHNYSTLTADVSLTYVYLAIASSLIAFVIILCKQTVGTITKTLFSFSIVLTMILVLGSLFSAITKATVGTSTTVPSELSVSFFSNNIFRQLSLYLIPVIIFVILLLVFRIRNQPKNDTERGNGMSESEDVTAKKETVTTKPEDFVKLNNAYHTAIELWKLASDQIYRRFSAMLTANSIILAVIGFSYIRKNLYPLLVCMGSCSRWNFTMYSLALFHGSWGKSRKPLSQKG